MPEKVNIWLGENCWDCGGINDQVERSNHCSTCDRRAALQEIVSGHQAFSFAIEQHPGTQYWKQFHHRPRHWGITR